MRGGCGGLRQVGDTGADEGAAIVDSHHHAAAVAQVRHPDLGAERQARVRHGQVGKVEQLAARGRTVVEALAVPGDDPLLHAGTGRAERQGQCQDGQRQEAARPLAP